MSPRVFLIIKIFLGIFMAAIGISYLTIGVFNVLGVDHQFDNPFLTTWFLFGMGGGMLFGEVLLLVGAISPESVPNFSRFPVTFRRNKLGKLQTIKIDRDRVRVREKGLFAADWEEPLSAFTGVVRRTRKRLLSSYGLFHLVELVHPYRGKSLRQYSGVELFGYDKETSYKQWRDAADVLDLPAYDEPTPKWTL